MATLCVSTAHPRAKDLSGARFGRLVVIEYAGPRYPRGFMWKCQCDCGDIAQTDGDSLRRGYARSCGCLRREKTSARRSRGFSSMSVGTTSDPATYTSYSGMISRCYNSSVPKFSLWGGRGISVCDRWRIGENGQSGYECFVADMGPRPSRALSIDRFPDNDGNYEPGNCRWASTSQQRLNQRRRL